MHYLRSWRMHLAREALTRGATRVTALGRDLGYQSDAAFRSVTGQSPREFRQEKSRGDREDADGAA